MEIGFIKSFFNVGKQFKDSGTDRIQQLILSYFNLNLSFTLATVVSLQSPQNMLITFLCMKTGYSKLVITLILAFLL